MAIGLGLLRLSPKDFWAMTPRELERAARVVMPRMPAVMGRHALDAMMRQFPDGASPK